MNKLFAVAFICLLLAYCSYEKDIQVESTEWILIKKIPAYRYGNENTNHSFIWLVWVTKQGDKFYERVPDYDSARYIIGGKIMNRDRR